MSISTDIVAALAADAPLVAATNSINEGPIPQGVELPVVTFNRVDTPYQHSLGATTSGHTSKPRYQFDVWATTPTERESVVELLIPALLDIQNAFLVDRRGELEYESGYWREIIDIKVLSYAT